MSNTAIGQPCEGGWYEIRLQGRLEPRWIIWFGGLDLAVGTDATTTLRGHVMDQAALHGLLQRLRDLGLPLISVTQVEPDPAKPPHPRDPHHSNTGDQP